MKTSKRQNVKTSKQRRVCHCSVSNDRVCHCSVSSGLAAAILLVCMLTSVSAQEHSPAEKPQQSAPALVRQGNQLLLNDKPAEAIELYDKAQQAAPDAREIAFGKGLSYYKLGEFDKARAAFEEAAAAKDDALADDALYSIGTVDHAQALAGQEADPKAAMSKLESAMQSYQGVLARNAEHEAARDANLKAATMWRQIKQQMEQQQQQQQGDQNKEENQDQQQQQNQQEQQEQQQQQDQHQQHQQQQQNQQQEQEQQNQQPQDEQQSESSQEQQNQEQQNQQEQEQQQQSSSQQQEQEATEQKEQVSEEDVSREQAERQLREMLQALRDRKKERPEQTKPMPIQRGTKDW